MLRALLARVRQGGRTVPFPPPPEPALPERFRGLPAIDTARCVAGCCNGCEADVNVLNTVVFDLGLGRFGIQLVASPRHADGLLVTGPVTENMRLALRKTYDAVPAPKLVVAVGACAISGGPYGGHPEVADGIDGLLPVDLFVPGCPPHPLTILDGLLRLLGLIDSRAATGRKSRRLTAMDAAASAGVTRRPRHRAGCRGCLTLVPQASPPPPGRR